MSAKLRVSIPVSWIRYDSEELRRTANILNRFVGSTSSISDRNHTGIRVGGVVTIEAIEDAVNQRLEEIEVDFGELGKGFLEVNLLKTLIRLRFGYGATII